MKAQRLWPSTFHAPYETVCQVVSKVFHVAAKDTSLSPVPEKVNYSSSLYLNVLSESYEVTGKGLGLSLNQHFLKYVPWTTNFQDAPQIRIP